jgi:glycerol-3-phosphate acyltransferase PlsY
LDNPAFVCGLFMLAAYLLGSFSSAITLSRIMGFADPRSEGSNNPGATNVLRIAGKKAAALTLFGDVIKGLLPVLAAHLVFDNPLYVALTGFSAFLGHCYPLYYGFEGGKGVATAIGFVVAFDWMIGLCVIAIWLLVAKTTKLSALAALTAFLCLPLIHAVWRGDFAVSTILAVMSAILVYRHKANIQRMLSGTETKSSLKKKESASDRG